MKKTSPTVRTMYWEEPHSRLAEVNAAHKLAHNHDIDSWDYLRLEGGGGSQLGQYKARPQVRICIQAGTKVEETILWPRSSRKCVPLVSALRYNQTFEIICVSCSFFGLYLDLCRLCLPRYFCLACLAASMHTMNSKRSQEKIWAFGYPSRVGTLAWDNANKQIGWDCRPCQYLYKC